MKPEISALAQVADIEKVSLYLAGTTIDDHLAWPFLMDELWVTCPLKEATAMLEKFNNNDGNEYFPQTTLKLAKDGLEREVPKVTAKERQPNGRTRL